jgi:S1-C subfamily serine protease
VAEILRVYPESPAARAGLRAGDRIIALAGRDGQERAIGTRRDLLDQFARVAEGEPVTITVLRKGQQRVITATTASRSL